MKKLSIVALLLCISVVGMAQTFEAYFLGEDFLQYKGALFKLKEGKTGSMLYHTFYSELKYCQEGNVIYPGKYNFMTVGDSLKNRIFKVENIVDKDGNTFISGAYLNKPIFVLKDIETNQTIYYKYDQSEEYNFPFLTSKIKLDTEMLCAKIKSTDDDFTEKITFKSPMVEGGQMASMIIYKIIIKDSKSYYLSLRAYGNTVSVDGRGYHSFQ